VHGLLLGQLCRDDRSLSGPLAVECLLGAAQGHLSLAVDLVYRLQMRRRPKGRAPVLPRWKR